MEVTDTPALIALCDHERKARRCLDDLPVFRSCKYVKAGKDNGGIGEDQRRIFANGDLARRVSLDALKIGIDLLGGRGELRAHSAEKSRIPCEQLYDALDVGGIECDLELFDASRRLFIIIVLLVPWPMTRPAVATPPIACGSMPSVAS